MYLDIIQCALADLAKYYSKEQERFIQHPDGFLRYREIIDRKISEVVDEQQTVWSTFIQYCREQLRRFDLMRYALFDFSFHQFANYQMRIRVHSNLDLDVLRLSFLTLDISLITNAYTLFVDNELSQDTIDIPCNLITNTITNNEDVERMKSFVHAAMKQFFPNHEHLEFVYAFKLQVEGDGPYYDEPDSKRKFTLYDYIFSPTYCGRPSAVLFPGMV